MKEKIFSIVYIAIFVLVVSFAIWALWSVPSPIEGDYSTVLYVEKAS